jgi:glutamate dehydrogenase/leucine dehydrogenase
MIMGWMMDQYSIIQRKISPGVVTGKPLAMGEVREGIKPQQWAHFTLLMPF